MAAQDRGAIRRGERERKVTLVQSAGGIAEDQVGTRDKAAHRFIGQIGVSHGCRAGTLLERTKRRERDWKWRSTLGMLILHGPYFSNSASRSLRLTFLEMFPTNRCIVDSKQLNIRYSMQHGVLGVVVVLVVRVALVVLVVRVVLVVLAVLLFLLLLFCLLLLTIMLLVLLLLLLVLWLW